MSGSSHDTWGTWRPWSPHLQGGKTGSDLSPWRRCFATIHANAESAGLALKGPCELAGRLQVSADPHRGLRAQALLATLFRMFWKTPDSKIR